MSHHRVGFHFECPLSVFSKADAPQGKQRRIAGLISTESPDRQGEVILQNGLDFDDFISHGWFNDNHSRDTTGILGHPESVKQFKRGEVLPDGNVAQTNCTWTEGYLLTTKKADDIWELGRALQETGRRLGFSIEGSIMKRRGPGNRVIAKAKVRNVAITNCPVNVDTHLEVLARSLAAIEEIANREPHHDCDGVEKTLTVGSAEGGGGFNGDPAVPVDIPLTGDGAGRILGEEDLEQDQKKRRRPTEKSLSADEARAWVLQHVPGCDSPTADTFVRLTKALKRVGLI